VWFARRHRDAGKAAYLAEMEAENRQASVEVIRVEREQAPTAAALALAWRWETRSWCGPGVPLPAGAAATTVHRGSFADLGRRTTPSWAGAPHRATG
jgi:hypothetical protein